MKKMFLLVSLMFILSCKEDKTATPKSSAKELLSFAFKQASNPVLSIDIEGVIVDKEIKITLPPRTKVDALKASFTSSALSGITVAGVKQENGVTTNNFTNPVTYRVTAEDGTISDYTIMVSVAKSSEKILTNFSILKANNPQLESDLVGIIDKNAVKIVGVGSFDVTKLIATFTTSTTSSVEVANIPQENGKTANNFSQKLSYQIKAEDGSTNLYEVELKRIYADFSMPTSTLVAPTELIFKNTSINADQSSWTFDNYLTSKDTDGKSIFASGGKYKITLQITSENGKYTHSVTKTISIEAGTKQLMDKSVRVVYLVPTDKKYNAEYVKGISTAMYDLQKWYKAQTGGYTFRLNNPIVEVYYGKQGSQWYTETKNGTDPFYNYWYNTFQEMFSYGMKYPDPKYSWVVYCDAYGGGAGTTGIAILPAEDFQGLIGNHKEPVSRWIGGLGHEIGHSFSLPHPASKSNNAIMGTGYTIYPNAILLPDEIDILKKFPFFFKE